MKAGDAAPAILAYHPTACEGLDRRLVDVLRSRRGQSSVPPLPRGSAWLFVELAADDASEVMERARALSKAGIGQDVHVVQDAAIQARLWRIREDGAGLAGRAPSGSPAWPGLEDAAVPPERLGAYLARFDELTASYGLTSAPYGHFGDGCLHVRLDFPLDRPDGLEILRRFLVSAAELVSEFGGSISGEHGDGRARGELLSRMYSPDAIALFQEVNRAFDPSNLLNPGVLVDPDPFDADVRVAGIGPVAFPRGGGFSYREDGGDLSRAIHRCTGVGKCRADNSASGGVMCPSYLATREELHSTRGRARVLQEVIRGDLDWRAPEVHEALDLCLSCKGCSSDCPAGVDMATYKSETLHRSYRRRIRPRSHYSLGWLPRWARIAGVAPRAANLLTTLPGIRQLSLMLAGVDRRRSVPQFASQSFRQRWRQDSHPTGGRPVLLFVDSFSNSFSPEVAEATVSVLRAAGYEPRLAPPGSCCGLTWITTGQLDGARRILARTVAKLVGAARDGVPIVGIEPSCTAVLRGDAVELLDSNDASIVAAATVTLAELLDRTHQWTPLDLSGTSIIVQPHCHHHSVMGWDADRRLLERTRATVSIVAGCCGLAGNFGVEAGHYEMSVAVASQNLLPQLDEDPDAIVLADGFSCRTQVTDLRGRPSKHLAQLLSGR